MSESTVYILIGFLVGALLGVVCTLIFNKVRGGSVSPGKVKRELEDYQAQVEAHFDETSDKFRAMAEQYKDLYQHLSVGATTLCRPDHIVPGLTDEGNPLGTNQQLSDQSGEAAASTSPKADKKADKTADMKAEKDAPASETKNSTGDNQAAPSKAGKDSATGSTRAQHSKGTSAKGNEAAKKAPAQAKPASSAAKAAAAADEKSHASAAGAGQANPSSDKPKQKPV